MEYKDRYFEVPFGIVKTSGASLRVARANVTEVVKQWAHPKQVKWFVTRVKETKCIKDRHAITFFKCDGRLMIKKSYEIGCPWDVHLKNLTEPVPVGKWCAAVLRMQHLCANLRDSFEPRIKVHKVSPRELLEAMTHLKELRRQCKTANPIKGRCADTVIFDDVQALDKQAEDKLRRQSWSMAPSPFDPVSDAAQLAQDYTSGEFLRRLELLHLSAPNKPILKDLVQDLVGKPVRKPEQILVRAAKHIADRAEQRDVKEERSMAKCVRAFNELYGKDLTETEGWQFMSILKKSRAAVGTMNLDDYEDDAAYTALAGESAQRS